MMKAAILLLCIISTNALANDFELVDRINYKVNQVKYVLDIDNYGVNQYMGTTAQFYANGGDCEDYARVKHEELVKAGYAGDISYVWAAYDNQMHVMLKAGDYILDNRDKRVRDMDYVNRVYDNPVVVELETIKLINE